MLRVLKFQSEVAAKFCSPCQNKLLCRTDFIQDRAPASTKAEERKNSVCLCKNRKTKENIPCRALLYTHSHLYSPQLAINWGWASRARRGAGCIFLVRVTRAPKWRQGRWKEDQEPGAYANVQPLQFVSCPISRCITPWKRPENQEGEILSRFCRKKRVLCAIIKLRPPEQKELCKLLTTFWSLCSQGRQAWTAGTESPVSRDWTESQVSFTACHQKRIAPERDGFIWFAGRNGMDGIPGTDGIPGKCSCQRTWNSKQNCEFCLFYICAWDFFEQIKSSFEDSH